MLQLVSPPPAPCRAVCTPPGTEPAPAFGAFHLLHPQQAVGALSQLIAVTHLPHLPLKQATEQLPSSIVHQISSR